MAEFPANLVRSAFSRFAFSGFGGQKVAKNFAVPPRFKVADADTDQAEERKHHESRRMWANV